MFIPDFSQTWQKGASEAVLSACITNLLESNMIPSSTVTLRANCVGCVLKQKNTKETESQKTTVAMNRWDTIG